MYDYIIVGSGLYGAIFAHEAMKAGKSCLVVERRSHIGGNIYTKEMEGIQVHQYGAHIFHTSNKEVWDYIGQFATFNRYTNCPVAYYKGLDCIGVKEWPVLLARRSGKGSIFLLFIFFKNRCPR